MFNVVLILSLITPFIVGNKFSAVKELSKTDGSKCKKLTSKEPNKHSNPLAESCINTIAKFSTTESCRYCPPGLVPSDFGTFCFSITPNYFSTYDGSNNVPSGVTQCDQLVDLCDSYNGFSGISGSGENTRCYCFAQEIEDCYEENKLYAEGSLPMQTTLNECFEACQSATFCEFFTWNSVTQGCGLRSYKPNALIKVPNLRTGTRDGGILSTLNRVYVGDAFTTSSKVQCKRFCEQDNSQCQSVTFSTYSGQNSKNCVLNYGPVIRVIDLPPNSGVASCEPCPGP